MGDSLAHRGQDPAPALGGPLQAVIEGLGDMAGSIFGAVQPSSYQAPAGVHSTIDLGRGLVQAGSLDPAAQKDFERAEAELKGHYQIVSAKDAARKDHAPNAITQEDFEKVAHEYSDIRRGKTDLQFAQGTDQKFQDGAMQDIAAILETDSGRRLIAGLADNVGDKSQQHRRTELGAANRHHDFKQEAFPLVDGTGDDMRNRTGTDMSVEYAPGKLTPGTGGEGGEKWMPVRSDVTLYHELTHALHGTHGRQDLDSAEEERETVGLRRHELPPNSPLAGMDENTYRAERARIGQGKVGVIEGDKDMARRRGYGTYREPDHPAPKPGR